MQFSISSPYPLIGRHVLIQMVSISSASALSFSTSSLSLNSSVSSCLANKILSIRVRSVCEPHQKKDNSIKPGQWTTMNAVQ